MIVDLKQAPGLIKMEHPLHKFSDRRPALPGHRLYCPECLGKKRFVSESSRDLHYFQCHVLDTPKEELPNRHILKDNGNYDGPLGGKQHILPPERYVQEPESTLEKGLAKSLEKRPGEMQKKSGEESCSEVE